MKPDGTVRIEAGPAGGSPDPGDASFSRDRYETNLESVATWLERMGGDRRRAFARVLIVNNGLSALRLIQGIASLSNLISDGSDTNLIQAVAIASDADWVGDCPEDAQRRPNYLKEPDIIIARIHGSRPRDTYQDQDTVISIAKRYRCDAIAVGWGHLAENATFASRVEREGLVFVGPHSGAMSLMGDKIMSKLIMDEARVPLLPWNGSDVSLSDIRADVEVLIKEREEGEGPLSPEENFRMLFDLAYSRVGIGSMDQARAVVHRIGLPVVIKATAGGGGRGIRFVTNEKDLQSGLQTAISEASAAFGNGTVFIEKVADPGSRHIEVQVLADEAGTVIALGERECSIQRHNQKLIEESGDDIPISEATRRVLRNAAVAAAKAAGYINAGTVEFLVDRDGNPFFMEMNTRLQVEHIATEAIYPDLDLVVEQLKIAMGLPIDDHLVSLADSLKNGRHSISVRIMAENPNAGFSSQSGTIVSLDLPNMGPNTPRAYFGFGQGGTVHSFADSQIGHAVISAPDRETARRHMVAFLSKMRIKGILTTLQFSVAILQDADYIDGKDIHVSWLKQRLDGSRSTPGNTLGSPVRPEMGLAALAIFDYLFQKAEAQDKFHSNLISSRSIAPRLLANTGLTRVKYGGRHYTVIVREIGDELYELVLGEDRAIVRFWERLGPSRFMMEFDGTVYQVYRTDETSIIHIQVGGHTITFERDLDPDVYRAPLAGIISSVDVKQGQSVSSEDTLFTIEAMKMISSLGCPRDARIAEVYVESGSVVEVGTPLLRFESVQGSASVEGAGGERDHSDLKLKPKSYTADPFSRLLRMTGYSYPQNGRKVKAQKNGKENVCRPKGPGKGDLDPGPEEPVTLGPEEIGMLITNIMRGYQLSNQVLGSLNEEIAKMRDRIDDMQWMSLVKDSIEAFYKDERFFKGSTSLVEGLAIAERMAGITGERKFALARSHANLPSKKALLLSLLEPVTSMDLESMVSHFEKLIGLGYSDKHRDLSARAEELIHLIQPLHERPIDLPQVMEEIVEAHKTGNSSLQTELMSNVMAATESMLSQLIDYLVTGSGFARKIAGKLIILRAYRRHRELSCEYEHIPGGKRLYVWRFSDADTAKDRMGLVGLVEPGETIRKCLESMYGRLREIWLLYPERTDHTGDVLEVLIRWPSEIKGSDELSLHLKDLVNEILASESLSRVTFVVRTPYDQIPVFFTFRPGADGAYIEDTLCRNLHPSLAYLVNLKQLEPLRSNIVKLPSADPLVHIFHHRIPNQKGPELPDNENRIFVRTVIRNPEITIGSEGPSFPAAEEAFTSSLRHLRVSYVASGARSHNNQIFMAFAKPLNLSVEEFGRIVKRMMNKQMGGYADVDLTRTEIRGRVRSWQSPDETADVLLVIDNPTGLLMEMKQYVIETSRLDSTPMIMPLDDFIRSGLRCGEGLAEGRWMPLSELIKPMTSLDKKRLVRRQSGKAYVYDRIPILRNELENIWACSGVPMPEEVLMAQELATDPKGAIVPIQRPAGNNDLSIVAWKVRIRTPEIPSGREVIVVSGDMTHMGGSVSIEEDILFSESAMLARDEGIPFVYFAEGSGARIGLATIVTKRLSYDEEQDVFYVDGKTYSLIAPLVVGHRDPKKRSRYIISSILGGLPGINVSEDEKYLYVSDTVHNRFKDRMTAHSIVVVEGSNEKVRWVIDSIDRQYPLINFENLSGSAMMARACSLTYHSVPTMAVVTDTCTGIIAYNVRLLKRIVQTRNSEIILTGFRALNSLYGGDDVYSSNRELGGPHIMGPNGVSHHIVEDENQACRAVLTWLSGLPLKRGAPLPKQTSYDRIDRDVSEALLGPHGLIKAPGADVERPVPYDSMDLARIIFDEGSTEEALERWGGTVHVGRAAIGGIPVGFITVETRTVKKELPADPSLEGSTPGEVNQFGQVWYPDSAFKTSQWIQFMRHERKPLVIFPNWRGFAGGKIDLYEEIIKFGAMIVDELVHFDLPVVLYIPPYAELRGGAWVVVDTQINPDRIVLLADEHATGSVLEPSGMEAVPLIQREISRDMIMRDPVLIRLYKNRTKYATEMDRIKKIDREIEERESVIRSDYVRKWTRIFRLHNTAERMGVLGIAREVVPTNKAREAIFRHISNGLSKIRSDP